MIHISYFWDWAFHEKLKEFNSLSPCGKHAQHLPNILKVWEKHLLLKLKKKKQFGETHLGLETVLSQRCDQILQPGKYPNVEMVSNLIFFVSLGVGLSASSRRVWWRKDSSGLPGIAVTAFDVLFDVFASIDRLAEGRLAILTGERGWRAGTIRRSTFPEDSYFRNLKLTLTLNLKMKTNPFIWGLLDLLALLLHLKVFVWAASCLITCK